MGIELGLDLASAPQMFDSGIELSLPDAMELSVWDLGRVYERSLDAQRRHAEGIHYTPPDLAARLAALAVGSDVGARVCDPAVGTGAFLLGAAMHLESLGLERQLIVEERLWGIDLDVDAIAVASASLSLWAAERGHWAVPSGHLVPGDTLEMGRGAFGDRVDGFDVVVGNPPFQSQLLTNTARSPEQTQRLRERWSVDVEPYADTAAFFLLAGMELVKPGGTMALIQPRSLLASSSVEPIREALAEQGVLGGLWIGDRDVFDADVEVCAPFAVRDDSQREVARRARPGDSQHQGDRGSQLVGHGIERWEGWEVSPRPPTTMAPVASSWAPLVSDLTGVPAVRLGALGRLADVATATAGFRDEFYALAEAANDDPIGVGHPLITVGMIDPLRNRWGVRSFRLAGRDVECPRVSLDDLDGNTRVGRWVEDRLVPKLLVATQTKVIEVVVDEAGDLVPCTPVVAVAAPVDRLWHIAAALSAPACTAVALARVSGNALSSDTIKMSARQVLDLPLPRECRAWDRGAELAAEAANAEDAATWSETVRALGAEMQAAYGINDKTILEWWQARLPGWR
ncbi:MAG: HsdM family class I SAM-dependent methyltransferase [Acidimicrobiales bacterium]